MPKDSNNKQIDWEKLYPFTQKRVETISNSLDFIEKLNSKFKSKIAMFEEKFNKYFPHKFYICEIQMAFEKFLGKNLFLEYEGTVVLNNGYLDYYGKNSNPSYALKNTIKLHEFIKIHNTEFVFVIYPCKNSKFDNQLPKGLKDNINYVCDVFLQELNKREIKTLDLRENARIDFKSQYDMFFRTDHHWKPSTGLWAAKEIFKYFNKQLNWDINTSLLDKENFKITKLPNYFLGSQGKKVTLSYVEPDDFEIIEPYYDTNFQRFCPEWGNASGSFKNIMFDKHHIKIDDYYSSNPYCFYLNKDMAYLRIINNCKYPYNKKVLLIKDSFNLVVAPFLALGIKDLTLIDIRHFNGSIRTLIEKEKFDLVLIAYNTSMITGEKNFNFK